VVESDAGWTDVIILGDLLPIELLDIDWGPVGVEYEPESPTTTPTTPTTTVPIAVPAYAC
jgi:hypothetical protein